MIVRRQGEPPNFSYVDTNEKKVTDISILDYIKSLVIPPKYTDVKINVAVRKGTPCQPDKLTYTGVDEKGRTQYGYSSTWKRRAAKEKYKSLVEFGETLPKIRTYINKKLSDPDATKDPDLETNIALIIRIVNLCHFRLGNIKYKDLYKSYGISTIEVRHVKIKSPDKATITFIGKKGVKNKCVIECPEIVAHLANLVRGKAPKDAVFSYNHEDCVTLVKATDINDWMRAFSPNITSKMFRTYATNVMLIDLLRNLEDPEKQSVSGRKRSLNLVLDEVSDLVHNTRAVCKKEYTHPDLVKLYIEHPRKFKAKFMGTADPEPSFLAYLKSTI